MVYGHAQIFTSKVSQGKPFDNQEHEMCTPGRMYF